MKQISSIMSQYRKNMISISVLLCFALLPLYTFAQPGGDEDVVDVPLDGGLSLLLVAGASYGIKAACKVKKI